MIGVSFLFFLGPAFSVVFEGLGASTETFLIFTLLFNGGGGFPFDFEMDFRSFVLVDEELEGDVEGGLLVVFCLAEVFFFFD